MPFTSFSGSRLKIIRRAIAPWFAKEYGRVEGHGERGALATQAHKKRPRNS
jgi:hypothetical protein